MKHFLLVFVLLSSFEASADRQKDVESIKAMSGCYEVTFNFAETFVTDKKYKTRSPLYSEKGLELVFVDDVPSADKKNEVHLQHILLIPDGSVMKHWRQDWTYEPKDLWVFKGRKNFSDPKSPVVWEKTALEKQPGFWKQSVTQVDDSPRYECSAPWVHIPGKSYWECTSPAPLPRREFTKRKDYDVLNRRNRHEITSWGWMHEQDNQKLISKDNKKVAEEKGYDRYTKVEEARCQAAADWWQKNKTVWNAVQDVWGEYSKNEQSLALNMVVDKKKLWESITEITVKSEKAIAADAGKLKEELEKMKGETRTVINKYLNKTPAV